jgi:hypothetical protein
MNILIFGKDGQLGKAFKSSFESKKGKDPNRVYFVGRAQCDLANFDAVTALLNEIKPDLIINAAAYTAVDRAEIESDGITRPITFLMEVRTVFTPRTICEFPLVFMARVRQRASK